jgi:hypothetical protein
LSIEYPTSSVRIQYTTVSVGVSSFPKSFRFHSRKKSLAAEEKIHQFRLEIKGKPRYNRAEEYFIPLIPRAMATACKHPRVRIVSRQEDSEFVECLDCGEVFDSDEFQDMEIEETAEPEDVQEDA